MLNPQRYGHVAMTEVPLRESLVDFQARYARPLDLIAPHCDILERLTLAPSSARLRGLLFRAITEEVQTRGKLEQYRKYFTNTYSAIPYYALGDYLVRIAVAGALIASPSELHRGMYELSAGNAKSFAASLLGRALIRLLARDPVRLTEQGIAMRRQVSSYGDWSIVRHGPKHIEVVHQNEYVWIHSAVAGSAAGMFITQDIPVELETRMIDKFNGSTIIRW